MCLSTTRSLKVKDFARFREGERVNFEIIQGERGPKGTNVTKTA